MSLTDQVSKLAVPILVVCPSQPFAIRSQAILTLMQQTPNGGPTNGEPLATQSSAKPANRFMRPLHPRGRITCRNILQQILQSLDDSRIFFFDRFTATTRLAYSVGGILKGLFLVCKTTANRVRAHAGNLSSVFDGSSTRLACQVGNEQASPFFVKGCDHPIDGSMLFSSGTLGRFSTIPTGTLANPSMYCSGHNNLPLRLPREGKLIIPETFKLFPDVSLPRPDPGLTDPEADLEEPIHLLLTATSRVELVPQSAAS